MMFPQNRSDQFLEMPMRDDSQFDEFEASELFCARCKRAQPVRRRLLLVLPTGNRYEYLCSVCGESLGEKNDGDQDAFRILGSGS